MRAGSWKKKRVGTTEADWLRWLSQERGLPRKPEPLSSIFRTRGGRREWIPESCHLIAVCPLMCNIACESPAPCTPTQIKIEGKDGITKEAL